jgi:hypothetical protein
MWLLATLFDAVLTKLNGLVQAIITTVSRANLQPSALDLKLRLQGMVDLDFLGLCGPAFFETRHEPLVEVAQAVQPEQLAEVLDGDKGKDAGIQLLEKTYSGAFREYYLHQSTLVLKALRQMADLALAPDRLQTLPKPNAPSNFVRANVLNRYVLADIEQYEQAFQAVAPEKFSQQLIATHERMMQKGEWTAQDFDAAIDALASTVAILLRLAAVVAVVPNPAVGLSILGVSEIINRWQAWIKGALFSTYAMMKVLTLQHDVMISQALAHEAIVDGQPVEIESTPSP